MMTHDKSMAALAPTPWAIVPDPKPSGPYLHAQWLIVDTNKKILLSVAADQRRVAEIVVEVVNKLTQFSSPELVVQFLDSAWDVCNTYMSSTPGETSALKTAKPLLTRNLLEMCLRYVAMLDSENAEMYQRISTQFPLKN